MSIRTGCVKMGLPTDISAYYVDKLGISKMYDWQADCIHDTGVADGLNLVYCAPTSGGKTLVSELAILRAAITLRKKAIFILPFVSLVIEKERYFKKIANHYNRLKAKRDKVMVKGYHGDIGLHGALKENIIICTIEKANLIINNIILRHQADRIGCIVIDEMHTLGDSFHGYLLEILVRWVNLFDETCNFVIYYYVMDIVYIIIDPPSNN